MIFSNTKYSTSLNSQSSSKKTEEKKSRGLILEEQYGSGGESEISFNWYNSKNFVIATNGFQHYSPLVMLFQMIYWVV